MQASESEYRPSTVHAWYLYLYVHTIYSRTGKKGKKQELVLYMAPYSEWMGCGSGITKNCEWLKPNNEKSRSFQAQKQWMYCAKREFTAEKEKEFFAIKTRLYRTTAVRTPSYVRERTKSDLRQQYKAAITPPGTCRCGWQSGGNALCSWRGQLGHRTGGCEPRLNCVGGVCTVYTLRFMENGMFAFPGSAGRH